MRKVIKIKKVSDKKWNGSGYENHFLEICDALLNGYRKLNQTSSNSRFYVYKRIKTRMKKEHRYSPKPFKTTDFNRLLYPQNYDAIPVNLFDILECVLEEARELSCNNYLHRIEDPNILFIDYAVERTLELNEFIITCILNDDIKAPERTKEEFREACSMISNRRTSDDAVSTVTYNLISDSRPVRTAMDITEEISVSLENIINTEEDQEELKRLASLSDQFSMEKS